jgi:hypothetical protein
MSKPATHLITIDASAFLDLSVQHMMTPEQVGASVLIFAWKARGNEGDESVCRRVAYYPKRRWTRDREAILAGVKILVDASEHRVRRGRPVVSAARRAAILKRDGEVCTYCQTTLGPFHIDHIIPVSRGGSNQDDNLCVACAPCNLTKSAKVGREWY